MLPDYAGHGLVNLMASIAQACGARTPHPPLADLSPQALSAARNIVFFVIDGLGDNFLLRHGGGGALASRRRGAITSVFPSTTASAITTTYTGAAPLEHGLTGWFTYFGEAGCVGAPLPFTSRGDQAPLQARGVTPAALFTAAPIFDALPRRSVVVTSRDIVDSAYNAHHCGRAQRVAYDSAAELVAGVEAAAKADERRKFIYAYWPHYDRVAHRYGASSPEALAQLETVDAIFGECERRLRGSETVLLASADHGFVDVDPGLALELPAPLASRLRFPLCGERRVAYCHVHAPDEFIERARDWLGDRAEVRRSAELAAQGWFGAGAAHPRFAERIGDVVLLMRAGHTVHDRAPGERVHVHLADHGGTTEDEMKIPLIVAAT